MQPKAKLSLVYITAPPAQTLDAAGSNGSPEGAAVTLSLAFFTSRALQLPRYEKKDIETSFFCHARTKKAQTKAAPSGDPEEAAFLFDKVQDICCYVPCMDNPITGTGENTINELIPFI